MTQVHTLLREIIANKKLELYPMEKFAQVCYDNLLLVDSGSENYKMDGNHFNMEAEEIWHNDVKCVLNAITFEKYNFLQSFHIHFSLKPAYVLVLWITVVAFSCLHGVFLEVQRYAHTGTPSKERLTRGQGSQLNF